MLSTIQDLAHIQKLNNLFINQIQTHLSKTYSVRIGWPGGTRTCTVNYFPDYYFWMFSEINHDNPSRPKYLHALSIGEPHQNQAVSASCHINFPLASKSQVAGAFATDENGQIYILHTGNIHGYNQSSFWQNFRGQKINAFHSGKVKTYALVGLLGKPELIPQLADFVKEIERLKQQKA